MFSPGDCVGSVEDVCVLASSCGVVPAGHDCGDGGDYLVGCACWEGCVVGENVTGEGIDLWGDVVKE